MCSEFLSRKIMLDHYTIISYQKLTERAQWSFHLVAAFLLYNTCFAFINFLRISFIYHRSRSLSKINNNNNNRLPRSPLGHRKQSLWTTLCQHQLPHSLRRPFRTPCRPTRYIERMIYRYTHPNIQSHTHTHNYKEDTEWQKRALKRKNSQIHQSCSFWISCFPRACRKREKSSSSPEKKNPPSWSVSAEPTHPKINSNKPT